jgi:hypothetical protein
LSLEYKILKDKYEVASIRAIHDSLNIEDRITALIRKERILQYPQGTDLAGMFLA